MAPASSSSLPPRWSLPCSCDADDLADEAYERAAAPFKRALYANLPPTSPGNVITVVELGIGAFKNVAFYPAHGSDLLSVIGIEPDETKHHAAVAAAGSAGVSLRLIKAAAEDLPLSDASVDAVVSSLTLCTVQAPRRALEEAKRVLKPGGRLLFWEHVLSETDGLLAERQRQATPEEVRRWGCHLDRRTLAEVQVAGFDDLVGIEVDGAIGGRTNYLELTGLNVDMKPDADLMGPTAVGVAFVAGSAERGSSRSSGESRSPALSPGWRLGAGAGS